jgi:hypothetical protein
VCDVSTKKVPLLLSLLARLSLSPGITGAMLMSAVAVLAALTGLAPVMFLFVSLLEQTAPRAGAVSSCRTRLVVLLVSLLLLTTYSLLVDIFE